MNIRIRFEPHLWFFPFSKSEESCTDAVRRRDEAIGGDKRPVILVADDEPLIRQTIVEILRREGFDAVGVKDGMEAVECAPKLRPQVFLADISMPRLNGIEAGKAIRDLLPTTRVICISGHVGVSTLLQEARESGNEFEFLSKPIKPEVLLRTIQRE